MRRPNILVSFGLAATIASLGACSSDDTATPMTSSSASSTQSSAAVPTPAHLCKQVSGDAVKAIVGTVPPQTQSVSNDGVSMCQWQGDQDYQLAVSAGQSAPLSKAVDSADKKSSHQINDLGQKAFVSPGYATAVEGSDKGATLYVVAGPTTYYIAGIEDGKAPSTSDLETVARQVMG